MKPSFRKLPWGICAGVLLAALALATRPGVGRAAEPADCGNAGSSLKLARTYSTAGLATAIAAADFNQDGKADLAVGAIREVFGQIAIFLGDGSGYLELVAGLRTNLLTDDIEAGDFNKDGKPDLAVAGRSGPGEANVAILLGNGDGTFRTPNAYRTGQGPGQLAIADFNGDGNPDVAACSRQSSNVFLLRGLGDGTLAQSVPYAAGFQPSSLVATDFNGDGKPDLAAASWNSPSISLFANNGSGGFDAATSVDARFTCSSIAAGDFNGDNQADLVVGQLSNIAVLNGDGRGGFSAPRGIDARVTSAILVRDFNADGKPDLAFAADSSSLSSPSVVVMTGAGNGEFGSAARYGAGILPAYLAAADFNQDGKDDLAALNSDQGNPASSAFFILFGSGAARFQAPFVADAGSSPNSVGTGDFNKDGKPDLFTTNPSLGATISINTGQGAFGAPQRLDFSYGIAGVVEAAAAGDFNKDGNVDMAVASGDRFSSSDQRVTILHGLGNGSFDRNRTRILNVATGPADIVAADFNGDGDRDLATANPASNDVSLLLSNGAGGFAPSRQIPVGPEPRSLVAGDFNGDAKPDLAVANRNSATLTILLNNGNGQFASSLTGAGANPRLARTGDFNNDGKLDLAVPNHNAGFVSILLGAGNGTFGAPIVTNIGGIPFDLAIGDFNSDGKPDLAASLDFKQDRVLFFFGAGAGRFNPAGEFTIRSATYLATGDFDADGIADLAAAAGSLDGFPTIWTALGQCNPSASIALTNTSAASYRRLALAPDSIVAAFGAGLSMQTAVATGLPLPVQLGGATVRVKDSAGTERAAPLFFVSPNQINYLMPPATAAGAATVTIASGGASSTAATQIAAIAPGLFTANATGQGIAAGVALRIKPDGRQIYEPVAQFDAATNQFVPVTIQLSGLPPLNLDRVYLILFGAGLRGRSSLANVKVQIGFSDLEALFVGAQGGLAGLDQVNVLLPQDLGSRGDVEVVLTLDGKISNAVRIRVI